MTNKFTFKFYPEQMGAPRRHWFWRTWLGAWLSDVRSELWMWQWKRRFDRRPADRKPPYGKK